MWSISKTYIQFFSVGFFVVLFLSIPLKSFASYQTYSPGTQVTLGEFVYEDDFTASTADCTITVTNPNGDVAVNAVTMTENADGWHYHSFTPASISGVWPSMMSCGTEIGGDLVKTDKTFVVGYAPTDNSTIATSVWAAGTRTLTSAANVAGDIWDYSTRTLSSFGTLAADIWNDTFAPTRRLTDKTLTGGGSLTTESYLATSLSTTSSDIITEVVANRTLINALNNVSAADVWAYGTRSTNAGTVELSTASKQGIWDVAASNLTANGSVGKQIVDNLNATISSRGTSTLTAADVWDAATRTLTDYSTTSVATAVWANAARTLTSYGNDITAADVWNTLSSTLVTVGSIGSQVATNLDATVSTRASSTVQLAGWTVGMTNTERQVVGRVYRAKVIILNNSSVLTAPFATPTVSLYDASRNLIVSGVPTTLVSTGIYEYTYTIPSNAEQGLWETVVSSEVESGKNIVTNDYWEVTGSPAQVLINSVSGTTVPDITANITITNEGLTGYEYQYEWCVVTDADNVCGGGNDTYHATAAKFINAGEDFNTTLSATVATPGDYIFKLVVYYGTESSRASRTFTATSDEEPPSGGGGGGGGSGSGGNVPPVPTDGDYFSADLNLDGTVDSIDFSILLAYWKTSPPFRNTRADINKDNEVGSVDFSIMLYQWKRNK